MEFRCLLSGIVVQLFLFAQCTTWLQKAFIVIVNVVVWYLYMGLKYPQSDIKLIIKYGFPGCGKTLDLCKIAVESLSKGRKVYSSIPINVDGVILFDPSDFGHYRFYGDCVVLIDEGGIVFNNRNWKQFQDSIEYSKLHRHDKARIIIYSQSPEDTDVTLRRLAQESWDMKKVFGYFSLQRRIICENTIVSATSEDGVTKGQYGMNQRYAGLLEFKLYFQPYWYGLSDTYEMPERFTQIPSEVICCRMPYRFSDSLHKSIYRLNWLLGFEFWIKQKIKRQRAKHYRLNG